MSLFTRMMPPLGVHLGEDAFAVCEVTRAATGAMLRRVVFERYGAAEPARALAAAVLEHGWRRRSCVVGIAAGGASLHALHLPPMPAQERLAAARMEAERLSGSLNEPLAVDLAALANGWMLAAAPRTMVRALAEAVGAAGLRPRAVDLEILALARAIGLQHADAVLDIGARSAVLVLATTGVPFTRVLSSQSPIEALAAKVAEALEFAESRGFGTARRLLLSGAGALAEGIGERVALVLRRPVALATPRSELSTEHHPVDFVRATAPQWLVACGLALWELAELAGCA